MSYIIGADFSTRSVAREYKAWSWVVTRKGLLLELRSRVLVFHELLTWFILSLGSYVCWLAFLPM